MGPVTIAVDSYGPVTDNAQSVYELSVIESLPGIAQELKRDFGIDVKFEQAKAALRLALARLQPADTFNVIRFNHHTRSLYLSAQPASQHNLREAAAWVGALRAEGGTEIILESTANGMGDEFHKRWQEAEAGRGEYIAIFLPWFWDARYRRPAPEGFVLDEEEEDYAKAHGLDLEQMAWRRMTIAELGDPLLFKQEYPATASEAFQLTGHDSFIKPELVLRARKAELEGIGRLVLGVDPSRFGNDRYSIAWRRGRKVEKVCSKLGLDTVAGANWVKSVIDADKPAKVFVDVGGIGAGCYDLLRDWGYSDRDKTDRNVVRSIDFGGAPQVTELLYSQADDKPMAPPRNRRAEMWRRSRDWLLEPGGADLPDSDTLQADACAPTFTYDMQQRLLIESKEHMRLRGVRSPDEWDAVVLTFAEAVPPEESKPRVRGGRERHWMGS